MATGRAVGGVAAGSARRPAGGAPGVARRRRRGAPDLPVHRRSGRHRVGGRRGRARRSAGYGTLLADVSIYTSLESCAQCSGIMALANVREVAYLQYDQGQYLVGNLMYRATRGGGPGSEKRAGAPRRSPAEPSTSRGTTG